MTEKQANEMISLLGEILSKLNDIESNTYNITNLTNEYYVLDEIKKLLKNNNK